MHYFAEQAGKQPKAPVPSDTDLRSFATEYYASVFKDLGLPRASRLPTVHQLEAEFWEVSGQDLWKLVWGRTELSDEFHFLEAISPQTQCRVSTLPGASIRLPEASINDLAALERECGLKV